VLGQQPLQRRAVRVHGVRPLRRQQRQVVVVVVLEVALLHLPPVEDPLGPARVHVPLEHILCVVEFVCAQNIIQINGSVLTR